jgi:hypothetical protein
MWLWNVEHELGYATSQRTSVEGLLTITLLWARPSADPALLTAPSAFLEFGFSF